MVQTHRFELNDTDESFVTIRALAAVACRCTHHNGTPTHCPADAMFVVAKSDGRVSTGSTLCSDHARRSVAESMTTRSVVEVAA